MRGSTVLEWSGLLDQDDRRDGCGRAKFMIPTRSKQPSILTNSSFFLATS